MLITLIIVIGGCFFGYNLAKKEQANRACKIVFSILGGIFGFVVSLGCSLGVMQFFPEKQNQIESDKVQIIAFTDNTGVSGNMGGNFLVFAGTIGTESYFVFYYKNPDGGIKFGKLSSWQATIYEDEENNPYMAKDELVKWKEVPDWYKWLFFLPSDKTKTFQQYSIHVPKDTVKRQVILDSK